MLTSGWRKFVHAKSNESVYDFFNLSGHNYIQQHYPDNNSYDTVNLQLFVQKIPAHDKMLADR